MPDCTCTTLGHCEYCDRLREADQQAREDRLDRPLKEFSLSELQSMFSLYSYPLHIMEDTVTTDLSKFGCREKEMAATLLSELAKGNEPEDFEGSNCQVYFNTHSGNVFLGDEDYNIAMMNGDTLESFYSCPYCGHEGFKEDMEHEPEDEDCTEYMKQIQ